MIRKITLAVAGLAIAATAVLAASHAGPFDGAIKARQSHMRLNGHNLGILGAMAKGNIDYDADAASAAAANLAALARMSQNGYWPAGSDSFELENTRALPELWQKFDDVTTKIDALAVATAAMESAAGSGLEALQAAMGPVGGACGACHKAYRKPNS